MDLSRPENHLIIADRSHAAITLIAINRPEKCNALSVALLEQLLKHIHALAKEADQRALILYGTGPNFCAGLDLKEATDEELIPRSARLLADIYAALYDSQLITLCAIHGHAVAGGGGLAAACDFVIAAESTQITYPEVRRGLIPAQVATLLRRQLPPRKLRELLLLAQPITSAEALQHGLINKVVSDANLLTSSLEYVHAILEGDPKAILGTKALLKSFETRPIRQDLENAIACHERARHSPEAKRKIAQFFENTP